MLSVTPTPVELIDDDTATKYYNEFDTLEGAERESRAEALRLWAEQKKSDQKREQFDTLNKIYSDFDGYVNEAGLQDFDEDSRYRTANRQFIASQFDQTPEEQKDIYSSFRDKWTESVAGKKGMTEKETFDLIKQGMDARNEVTEAANQIPGDIALSLFDSIGGGDPVDVPKLIETWKTKNAESIKKLPPGWEAPLLESAQAFHTETEGMLRDYAEPLKKVYDHLAAVTGRDTERAGETNPKNQEEMDSMVDTLASMPKPVRERAYASVVLGAQKAGQDPKTFMEQWGESWSRTLNMVRTGALTAQEMAAESDLRMLEDKASPPDYYISKSTGEKIPLANRAFYDEADLRKVTPEEIAAEADQARQKVKRFEVVRELQSVADNQFDPIEKINKGGFLGFMEAMAYGSPQGLAYTATALVPVVGPYVAGAAMFSDEYNQLRQQGMSVDQAVQVGSVSAAVQAGLERAGAKALFGKLPAFEKLMRKIGNPARVGKAGSAGVRFLAAATGEQLVEGAQDLTTPLVQDVSEALGADVPDVKWQPILEKWGGSRLDVLAASLPTILLGTGVATFADNKRFAQFEERQDIYRSMGMDDATIKEIEDGKNLAEVQQNFQTAFGKLTPENVKAGVAYMEQKIASAQEQQQDPNTHTLTRETLADGSKKFVIRDPKGEVRYSTADEQTAQIALRELLRTQITGTTRGIFESISFFNQMNEAAGRGEDIQKFLLSDAPRNLLTDYEANPSEKNLNNLFETVRAFGQDISEPAELANFPVLASNQGTLAEGIFKSVIQIHEGATGDKVVRDVAQDNLKRAIAEGRIKMEWVRENLNQIIPQIESNRISQKLRTETDTDVIESFSDVALAYMRGNIRDEQIPAGLRGFLRRMAIVVKDIFRRAYKLKRLVAEGKVDANFESLLADSVGLNQQARVDTASNRVSKDIITDGGQMLMDFSIGSRTSAVSTDTPSIRASNATITGPANYSIGAYHGTPHKVDKFSTEKIGTGEGAQAYGWGLYFAEEKKVGEQYANFLSTRSSDKSDPKVLAAFAKGANASNSSEDGIRYLQGLISGAKNFPNSYKQENGGADGVIDRANKAITILEQGTELTGLGNLYTVDLDVEPEDLLDWDKPLSEQSEKVKAILKQAALNLANDDSFFDRDLQALEVARTGNGKPLTGSDVYADIQEALESRDSKAASEYLFSLGIPGIRYLDGGSRGYRATEWSSDQAKSKYADPKFTEGIVQNYLESSNGNSADALKRLRESPPQQYQIAADALESGDIIPAPTYNYVVFDENLIKITEENGNRIAAADAFAAPSPGATNYSIGKKQDADYLAAVERGDMETAQKMVDEAAKAAGYLPHGDFRDSHTAPSGPEGADEEVKNGDADASLVQVARGVHIQPDDYFDPRVGPRYYSYQDKAGMEAFKAIRAAMDEIQQGKKALVTVFRAVPNDIKGTKLENRDWVTPSKTYAVDHGEARFGEGEYRIIKESIPAENLFWDGNDIREWGKDDGKDYAYKNTKNNRKLIDPVTYDENGNVIPLSQRFNPRSANINYSIGFAPNGKPSNLKPEEQALARSPEFKARLGDWEALASLDKDVAVVVVKDDGLVGATIKELRKNAIQQTRSWWGSRERNTDLDADILINRDTLEHLFTHRGPIQVHAALHVPEIIRSARKVSDEEHEPASKSIAKVHRLVSAINFRGSIHRVDIVVKEHSAPKGHHAYDIEAMTVKTETAEKGLPSGASSAKRIGTSAVSILKVRDLDIGVNPESVTVKTDENGEPLASEIARFRQETGTSSFSIASQSEIDRVNRALGGMNRGPDARLAVYQRAKQKFSRVMQENKDQLDAIRSAVSTNTAPAIEQIEMDRAGRIADIEAEENTEVAKALQDNADTFLPRIEAAATPAERKRMERDAKDRAKILEQGIRDKYAERKKSTDAEAKSQRDQTLQAAAAKDSAANARMRDKVRQTKLVDAIGELNGILEVLPPEVRGRVGGFAVLANIGTGDKALADFFVKRIDMIDRQLERTLKEEYGNVFDALLERTKPKKAAAGEKPKGIGADIQSLFATVREARDWSAEKVDGHIANIETQIASGNLTAQEEAMLTREADLVSLVGDWKNADSSRRAAALSAATETWAKGMSTFVQKKIREREERDMARAEAISATGKKGDYVDRRKRVSEDNGLRGKIHGWFMNTISWDQAVNVLFGHESPMAIRLSDGQRKAEYTKIDAIQAKEDALHDLFAKLAGGKRVDGERLMWKMSQPSISANGLNLSELEALAAPMMWAQEDGRRHMTGELNENGNPISKWHYDQQFIDDIESQLSPEAKAIRDFLLNNYGKEWFSINSVFREMNGINLPRIPNYSPITVAPINAPSGMVTDPVTGNAVSATSISPGALRTRGVAIAEPVFRNVVQTYIAHTRQMEHWKAFAPWIKEANGILRNRDVQNSIKEAGGEEATGVLNRYLDIFAQGGNRDASLGLEISKTMGGMFSRAAQVALVGRVGTLAIQTTQIGAASAELPWGAYLSRLGKLVTGNLGWGDAINSKYIQRRIKQMPPTVQIAMEGLKAGKPNELKHQVEKIGQLISGTDALWTAGTYAMVYDYQLGQAKALGYRGQSAEDYAHNIAERITDRLAQPTRMGTRSIYELTATNPGARLAWAFASESRKNLALLAYTKANRPLKRFLAATAGYVVFNLAMGALIRNAWKDMRDDGDDEDDFFDEKTWNWKRMGVAMFTEPLQGMPLLGDYTEKGINAALGQYHQSSDLINFERGIKSFKNIPDILQGERDAEGVLKDIDGMVSLMGLFNQNAAAAASLTHIASDFFGVVDNATTED